MQVATQHIIHSYRTVIIFFLKMTFQGDKKKYNSISSEEFQ